MENTQTREGEAFVSPSTERMRRIRQSERYIANDEKLLKKVMARIAREQQHLAELKAGPLSPVGIEGSAAQ